MKPKDLRGKFAEVVEVSGKELRFKEKLTDGFVMAGLTGFDPEHVKHRAFDLRHAPSGVRVNVVPVTTASRSSTSGESRRRSARSRSRASNLKPGESKIWRIAYSFEHDPAKK